MLYTLSTVILEVFWFWHSMDQTCEILVRPVLVMEATSAIPTPLEHWSAVLLLPCLAIFIFASQDDAVPTKSFAQPLGSLALAIPLLFLNFRDVVTFSDGKGENWQRFRGAYDRSCLKQQRLEQTCCTWDISRVLHGGVAEWTNGRCGMWWQHFHGKVYSVTMTDNVCL